MAASVLLLAVAGFALISTKAARQSSALPALNLTAALAGQRSDLSDRPIGEQP
jgi:hypothetical protein